MVEEVSYVCIPGSESKPALSSCVIYLIRAVSEPGPGTCASRKGGIPKQIRRNTD